MKCQFLQSHPTILYYHSLNLEYFYKLSAFPGFIITNHLSHCPPFPLRGKIQGKF